MTPGGAIPVDAQGEPLKSKVLAGGENGIKTE